MNIDLEQGDIEMLIEALDCLKTMISFKKGPTYAEKTERLMKVEALETKLRTQAPQP
jgi:hypothetical protein